MDKILRVNMTDPTTKIEDVPAEWAGYGGRGLTSTIVAAEVPSACHSLGPNNKPVFRPRPSVRDPRGFTNAHDRLSGFFTYEPCPPHNPVWDF